MVNSTKIGVVCVAGGRGERFGGDKLAAMLGTRTVLECSLFALRLAFPNAPFSVVLPADRMAFWQERLRAEWNSLRCIEGGARRQDSVRRGVEAVAEPGVEIVAIHDGARPLVHPSDILAAVEGIGSADACILGQPASDTVKRVDARAQVLETIPRQDILLAQTPQVFRLEALRGAWKAGDLEEEWTDEAALLESLGMRVATVAARYPNPKLTTEADLIFLRALATDR